MDMQINVYNLETNMYMNLMVASISILLPHKVHQFVIYSSTMWKEEAASWAVRL
jgi:hypothetical protein